MSTNVQQQVVEALAKAKSLDPGQIRLESTFEELGVDSLDAIELLFELEERYQVAIPDEDAKKFQTVGEVVAALEQALASDSQPPEAP